MFGASGQNFTGVRYCRTNQVHRPSVGSYRGIWLMAGSSTVSVPNLEYQNDRIHHTLFPTQAQEVFDVTGAGDTAIGVFALCMASGATFKEAAFLANHAAGIVVGKVGTSTVSQAELKRVL